MNLGGHLMLLNPAMLWGLGLLSLPLIAHVLNRHADRRILFPSIRLLTVSAASQSRLFKLRRLILLLLRLLAMILLVLTFARPKWFAQAAAAAGETEPREAGESVVVVVDGSLSSGQYMDSVQAFSVIKADALRLLADLRPGTDQVHLIAATQTAKPIFDQFTGNIQAARQELERLQPTAERADLTAAVTVAGNLLKNRRNRRRLIVFSDMQTSNWLELSSVLRLRELLPPDTELTLTPWKLGVPENVGLARPRVFPAQPINGQPARLLVDVHNYSPHPRSVPVTVYVDGQSHDTRTVMIGAWGQATAGFQWPVRDDRFHAVRFSIPEDALSLDNAAYLGFRAVDRVPVLILGQGRVSEPGSADYFLSRGLAPNRDGRDYLSVQFRDLASVDAGDLNAARVVVVSDCDVLPPERLQLLRTYLDKGGSVIFFAGHLMGSRHLHLLQEGSEPLLVLNQFEDLRAGARYRTIKEADWQSPMFTEYDHAGRMAITGFHFWKTWTASTVGGNTLLEFNDGTPAAVVGDLGRGSLLVCNFSPSQNASDVGQHGTFVALLHSIVNYMQPLSAQGRQPFVGGYAEKLLPLSANSGGTLLLRAPDGNAVIQTSFIRLGQHVAVAMERAEQPGLYTVEQDGRVIDGLAVNIDPRESDLRQLTLTVDATTAPTATGAEARAAQRPGRDEPHPLWGWCLAAAMAVLGVEALLLRLWAGGSRIRRRVTYA